MSRSTVFQFRARDSIFHRADPLTKFAWMLTVSLLAFGAYIAWIQIAITVMVLATALILARITVREILQGTWPFLFACTSFFVIQTLTLPGTTEIFRILGKPIYVESADYALASALRIYTIILASLVFVRSTDPRELAITLVTQMKIPYRIAYAFFIALRIIPTIEEEIKIIRSAQAGRGAATGGGRTHPRSQALCHAAPRRGAAACVHDGDVDGSPRLRSLSPAHVCRGAAYGFRRAGRLRRNAIGRRRLVHRPRVRRGSLVLCFRALDSAGWQHFTRANKIASSR